MISRFETAELFVIGASAGGIDMLTSLIPAFRKTSHLKVALVIHMPPAGPNLIPSLLKDLTELTVKEADAGEILTPDHIYIAPPDYHLMVEPNGTLTLNNDEPVNFSRPSIDILFESAAYARSNKVVGILLTGSNEDGARGLKLIKDMGGITIVQNPEDADFDTMPLSALKIMKPDLILTKDELVEMITEVCTGIQNV